MNFQVGDRVRRTNNTGIVPEGTIGIIANIDLHIEIIWNDYYNPYSHKIAQNHHCQYSSPTNGSFELIVSDKDIIE